MKTFWLLQIYFHVVASTRRPRYIPDYTHLQTLSFRKDEDFAIYMHAFIFVTSACILAVRFVPYQVTTLIQSDLTPKMLVTSHRHDFAYVKRIITVQCEMCGKRMKN